MEARIYTNLQGELGENYVGIVGEMRGGIPPHPSTVPGPLRARITPPDTFFPELRAKTGTVLHTFSKNARIAVFKANGAFSVVL